MRIYAQATSGLTLIETVLALLVISISMTALFALQGALMRGVFSAHAVMQRIAPIKNFWVQADKEHWYSETRQHEQKHEEPEVILSYATEKVANKPELKDFKDVVIERIEAQWSDVFGKRLETFVSFRFVPPPPESGAQGAPSASNTPKASS